MDKVTSKDGTTVAFDRLGDGPPVILVCGGSTDRMINAPVAQALAPRFTVFNYDRRGRGASGDTAPYAVQREVEDIAALVEEAGGSAFLFGSSSGAALALEAAAQVTGVERLALFEPPFVVDANDRRPPSDLARRLDDLLAADRRAKAVTYFMTKGLGMPAAFLWLMRLMPRTWSNLKAMAPTIPYDVAVMGDTQAGKPLPSERWASVTVPTLVMHGGKSPPHIRHAATALAEVLPKAQHRTVDGVSHGAVVMAPKKLVPALREFFEA